MAEKKVTLEPRGRLWGWRCSMCGETEVGTGRSGNGYADRTYAEELARYHAAVCWDLDWADVPSVKVDEPDADERLWLLDHRVEQILATAHRVRPSDVGVWRSAGVALPGPADAVLIAPADLEWMVRGLRASRTEAAEAHLAAAKELEEAADEIRRTFADPDRRRPRVAGAEFGTDLANDSEWAEQIVRARAARLREQGGE